MAINLAAKYSDKILTYFTQASIMKGMGNNDYSFEGVKTVKIYTPVTIPLGDYTRSGANRYGTPVEMQDTLQELTMTQDKGFALTIDKGNNMEQLNIKGAARMLRLQIDERVIPEYERRPFCGGFRGAYQEQYRRNDCGRADRAGQQVCAADRPDHSDPVDQVQHAAPVSRVYRQRPSGQDQPGEGSGGRIHELPCGQDPRQLRCG